jgi:pseudouridine synthase, rluA family
MQIKKINGEEKIRMESKLIIDVPDEETGERIDSFLSGKTDFTRTRIQQLIKDRNITVNGKPTKSSYKIEENDEIAIEVPEVETTEIKPENIKIDIVYEDSDIAVINKQAGLVVHPAHGHYSGTLVNAILYHIKDLSGINGEIRPGIVHRLDKDTSGLIVIAKNDKVHTALTEMFQEKKIRKTYLAILKGKLNKSEGKIVTQIGRDKNNRKKMTVIDDVTKGKTAITNYRVISQNNLFTLVKVNIETGRTHQIRVHMRHLGYPILGDSVYGRKDNEKRQMLHAYKLEFLHPVTGRQMEFIGEIPEDFQKALKKSDLKIDEIID